MESAEKSSGRTEKATLASGCFWCTEAVFENLKGVKSVKSGYIGGTVENPTYKQVCSGDTGHAEAVEIAFDPDIVSFAELLELFWQMHDPTTLNRQGADVGTQYRSGIFYHSEEQKTVAEASRKALDESGKLGRRVVTEVTPASTFYEAEDYHQDYFRNNPGAGYCQIVIRPKLKKLGMK